MKRIQFKLLTTVILLATLLISVSSIAQEFNQDNYRTFFNFSTIKQNDNTRLLKVSYVLQNSEDKSLEHPVFNAKISFINSTDEEEVLLADVLTSKAGVAELVLPENHKYIKDAEGNITLLARFEATEKLEGIEEEIIVQDIFLDFNLTEIDSVKTITLSAYTLNDKGEEIPVEEVDVAFYVGGMLSKMKINDGMIENGYYEFDYDYILPGDIDGMLTFYASIEENNVFANVVKTKTMKWGNIHQHSKVVKNSLWSKNAPTWMYIVLAVLLIAVWSNYVYVIISLLNLKKSIKRSLGETPIRGNQKKSI